ncbi:hypothetical protein KY290_016409 [Solanum tuberosum]|uniref:Uncharacterized protein n=1 Tax=Solanum tuberosum TaxID=4113 RepID=A0ABQ7V8K6_SOLTU|nr:hypothetical protein KY290_016409 [Solanum tuberosum]
MRTSRSKLRARGPGPCGVYLKAWEGPRFGLCGASLFFSLWVSRGKVSQSLQFSRTYIVPILSLILLVPASTHFS